MTKDENNVRQVLCDQAVARALGELHAAETTYYHGDSEGCQMYAAIQQAIELLEAAK